MSYQVLQEVNLLLLVQDETLRSRSSGAVTLLPYASDVSCVDSSILKLLLRFDVVLLDFEAANRMTLTREARIQW